MSMRIVAIANQKGGCGKTTVAINLAASLARDGHRVLLIDLDPQGHCALGMAVPDDQIDLSMYDCLMGQMRGHPVELSRITWQITPTLDLAPSRVDLAEFEPAAAGADGADRLLDDLLRGVSGLYRYVIVDCPPHVGLLTRNALQAATDVIIPVETGYFSLHGLTRQLETVGSLFRDGKPAPRVRILPNQYDVRTKLGREILAELRSRFKEQVFQTTVNFNTKLKEGASLGQPITEFAPSSMGARDFRALARELASVDEAPIAAESLRQTADRIASDAERLLATTTTTLVTPSGSEPRPREPSPAAHVEIQRKIDRMYGAYVTEKGVVFRTHQPAAEEVLLAGDFNDWRPQTAPLRRISDKGDFEATLKLPPGRYHYRLVVDGRWTHDVRNPNVEANEFGELRSFIEIE